MLNDVLLSFITVAQKLNQGTIRNHGVADFGAFFWFFPACRQAGLGKQKRTKKLENFKKFKA